MAPENFSVDFQTIFETLPGSYVILLPDLTVAAVSDDYLKATHVKRDNLVGKYIFDVFPKNHEYTAGKNSNDAEISFKRVFQLGVADEIPVLKYDVRRPDSNGGQLEERFWSLKSFPGFDKSGNVSYLIHRVEDITEIVKLKEAELEKEKIKAKFESLTEKNESERRLAAEALKDVQMRLEAILDASSIGTWTWDIVNNRVFADKSLIEMFGLSQSEAENAGMEVYMKAIHPDDLSRLENLVAESLENTDISEIEYRIIQPDNSIRWVFARSKTIRDKSGKPIQMPGVLVDITDREKRRQESEILQTISRQLVSSVELEDVTKIICQAVRDLLNTDGATFVLHEGDTVHYFDENAIEPLWKGRKFPINCCISGWSILERIPVSVKDIYVDERIPHAAYRETFVNSLAMMPVGPGEPVAAIGAYWANNHTTTREEINLLKSLANLADLALANARSYNEMRQARLTAEEASRLKDEFLATISHELRTPLNAILGWSQMFSGVSLNNTSAERAFSTIERNARSQNQLIEDLLDVSRIISGKLRLDVQPVALVSIIESALFAIKPAAEAKSIRLQTVLDPKSGPIYGDPDRLQQIIWNLLSNAIKFTPKNGKVQVRLEQVNSHIEIIVSDNGSGIEPDFIPYVFDRFRQADSSSKRQHGGLGLGLAIVRHLTELHGGTVEVSSDGKNKGSTFTIKLPRMGVVERQEEQRHPRSGEHKHFNDKPDLANVKILVVDDDEDTRTLLTMVLEQSSAEVKSVSSVAEALSLLENETFSLLISDIEMPQTDGYDLIQLVRKMPQIHDIPAIAVTAYARMEDRMRAIASGYNMHIPKPVESQELLTLVESLIKHSSYKRH